MRAVRACEHGMVAGSVGGGYAQSRLWFPVATPTPFLFLVVKAAHRSIGGIGFPLFTCLRCGSALLVPCSALSLVAVSRQLSTFVPLARGTTSRVVHGRAAC